jgi:voltage-gated potassium channel Kch
MIYRFIGSVLRGLKDPEFRGLLTLVIIILIVGTIFYHNIEQWNWLDSLYFSVTTLSTVGYGDLSPATDLGKIFTIIYIFAGIGVILSFVSAVASHARQQMPSNWSKNNKK